MTTNTRVQVCMKFNLVWSFMNNFIVWSRFEERTTTRTRWTVDREIDGNKQQIKWDAHLIREKRKFNKNLRYSQWRIQVWIQNSHQCITAQMQRDQKHLMHCHGFCLESMMFSMPKFVQMQTTIDDSLCYAAWWLRFEIELKRIFPCCQSPQVGNSQE